jgi:hypothetical protein
MESEHKPTINCHADGPAFETYICEHLAANPSQTWYSSAPTEQDRWPDAWCSICHQAYLSQNEWNEKNEGISGFASSATGVTVHIAPRVYVLKFRASKFLMVIMELRALWAEGRNRSRSCYNFLRV